MSEARAELLARIRRANRAALRDRWEDIPRGYRRSSDRGRDGNIELLEDRLLDYGAQVSRSSAHESARAVAQMLSARGARRMVVPAGLTASLLPSDFDFVADTGMPPRELDTCEGILTQCTLAIAETGTIILQNVPGQGRRAATLVPDYHLCLVAAADVVATVPEAIERLQPTAHLPTTFISGPSATADIEMTRIKGVHGPRFLDVVILHD